MEKGYIIFLENGFVFFFSNNIKAKGGRKLEINFGDGSKNQH